MGVSAMQHLAFGGTGTGRVGISSEALPDQPSAKMVMVFALPGNSGNLFVGNSGVTNTTGSDNATTGIPLDAGQSTPWFPCPGDAGLDGVYVIGSAADQDYGYVWLK